jgi:hypothetical protein
MLTRRLLATLAASCGLLATPAAAHADSTPGVAYAVPSGGICGVGLGFYCSATLDFVMALPTGTIRVDWGDGVVETFTPGSVVFQESHTWSADAAFNTYTVTMSVDGGPTTTVSVTCVVAGDAGVCD